MQFHLPYIALFFTIATSSILDLLFRFLSFEGAPPTLLGLLVIVAGIALGFWGRHALTIHATALSPYGTPTSLVTTGPFKFSRNPMYLSYVLVALGFAVILWSPLAVVPPIVYFAYLDRIVVPREEIKLRKGFSEYGEYAKKIRKWL